MEAQIKDTKQTLEIIRSKCWFYETARKARTAEVPMNMSLDEIPKEFRAVKWRLTKT